MKNFIVALKSEWFKNSKTNVVWMAVVFGASMPLLTLTLRLLGSTRKIPKNLYNFYDYFLKFSIEFFVDYTLPFCVMLIATYLAYIEQKKKGTEFMALSPISKKNIYLSKYFILLFYSVIAVLVFIGTAVVFAYVSPKHGETFYSLTLANTLSPLFRMVLSLFFITAFQYLIFITIPNFIISILISILVFTVNLFVNDEHLFFSWFPYTTLNKIEAYLDIAHTQHLVLGTDFMSVIAAGFLLCLGEVFFRTKIIKVLTSYKKMGGVVVAFVLTFLLFGYMDRDKAFEPYHKTVLAGTIDNDKVKQLYLVETTLSDTLSVIPVKEGRFHHEIQGDVPFNEYRLLNRQMQGGKSLYLGKNDSLYLDIKDADQKMTITGTALAANSPDIMKVLSYPDMVQYYGGEKDFKIFLGYLDYAYKDQLSKLEAYKTVDNYVLSAEQLDFFKMILFAHYKNEIYSYQRRNPLLYGDVVDLIPEQYQYFAADLPYDNNLLGNKFYLRAVLKQITKNREKDDLSAVEALPKSAFRSSLMYLALSNEYMGKISQEDVDRYLALIDTPRLKSELVERNEIMQRLMPGNEAPDFEFIDFDNKKKTLKDLRGRYVIFDVWASWCVPCLKQAPYFEKQAKRYEGKNILFVALNVDDKVSTFMSFKKRYHNKGEVKHLKPVDRHKFNKLFDIHFYPTYFLIDPKGRIVNMDVAKPAYKDFVETIDGALK